MDNKSDGPTVETGETDSLASRKERALKLLDQFEELFENWPLSADETLLSHSDFYNHRPPAIVNCTLEQLQVIYSRRKGILYAIRHKDERWYTEIEVLKRTAREQANLTGIAKSISEKKKAPSGVALEAKKKLAKAMGISLAQLDAMGAGSREKEFVKIVGTPVVPVRVTEENKESTKSILKTLQNTVKTTEVKKKPKRDLITGKLIEE